MPDVSSGAEKPTTEPIVPTAPKPEPVAGANAVAAQKRLGFVARLASKFFHKKQESGLAPTANSASGETSPLPNKVTGQPEAPTTRPPSIQDVLSAIRKVENVKPGEVLPIKWDRYPGEINRWLKQANLKGGPSQGREVLTRMSVIANRPAGDGDSPVIVEILSNAAAALAKAVGKGPDHGV